MDTHAHNSAVDPSEWMEAYDGVLAIDVYETAQELVIMAPLAGVRQQDLDITITNDQVIISGERPGPSEATMQQYHEQECYWGSFRREYNYPTLVDATRAVARLTDGILTIRAPKLLRNQRTSLQISNE
jgi:HSP20 family protein